MPSNNWMPRPAYKAIVDQAIAALGIQSCNLLVLHGVADIGKTVLRKQFSQALQQNYICAVVNGSGIAESGFPSVEQSMIDLRRGLGQAGLELQGFDIALAYYWAVAHPQQEFDATGFSQLQGVADQVSTWGDLVSSLASDLQKTVPYVGTASKIGWLLMNYSEPLWRLYQQSGCDLSAIEEAADQYEMLGQLPGLLARELQQALAESDRPAIVLIDGYEGLIKLGQLSWIEKMATAPNPRVLWVLFAETPLAWVDAAQQIQIQPLSEAESLVWLQQAGIQDRAIGETIVQLCQGMPIHLDACITTWRNLGNQGAPQLQDFAATTKGILAVYLRSVGETVHQAFMRMAIPRTWNQELFQQLAVTGQIDDWQPAFQQVTISPYVEEVNPGVWRLNSLVRQYYQTKQPEPTQRQIHEWLFHYHQQCYLAVLSDRSRMTAALKTLEEALYHGLSGLQPHSAAVWVLEQITDSTQQNVEERVVILEMLLEANSGLSLQHQAIARSQLGQSQMQLGQLEVALATLEQAREAWRSLRLQQSLAAAEVECDLAKIYLGSDRLFDARNACAVAKCIRTDLLGASAVGVAEVLNQEAQIAIAQNDYAEAIACNQQALEIQEAQPTIDPILLAKLKLTVAEIWMARENFGQAEQLCQAALAWLTPAGSTSTDPESGSEHPLAILGYGLLGTVYEKWGQRKWVLARENYHKALNLAETLLELSHPQTLQCLKALSRLSRKLGDSQAAQAFAERHNSSVAFSLGEETAEIADSLNRIAFALYQRGEYGKAEPLWKRSLQIRERQLGADHPDTASSLNNLAALYKSTGRYGDAEPLLVRSLKIRERRLGANHPDTALSLNSLAVLYESTGRYSDAEPLLVRSLKIHEQQLGVNHLKTAKNLNNLAMLYKSIGRYGDAEPLLVRSLKIHEQQLGVNHPDTAISLNNLAGLHYVAERYNDAELLYMRSLKIYEQQLGADHPGTAISLNNLAELYQATGRYGDAEPLLVRSLKIHEQQLGVNHPDTAISLNNLAELYQTTGRYNDAELLYVRSLKIYEQQLGVNHPDTAISLNNLAELYRVTGRYNDAELLYVRSLKIYEQQLGTDHPTTASSLNNLAELYRATGRYSNAEPLLVRSLQIREAQLGVNHSNTALSLNCLAGLYQATGRYGDAEPLYVRSLQIYEQQLGANHPDTAQSLNNLAGLYESAGRYSDAEPLLVRSLQINEQQLGANHPNTANSLNNLAALYQKTERYSDAEPLYVRSLQIYEQQLGADHPNIAPSLNNLAELYRVTGHYSKAESLYLQAMAILRDRLGETHPYFQTVVSNFVRLLKGAIQSGQTAQLSDHPVTQELLEQLSRS